MAHKASFFHSTGFGIMVAALFFAGQLLFRAASILRGDSPRRQVGAAGVFLRAAGRRHEKRYFQKERSRDQSSAFAGDAKMQQAMAADSIDIGIGSGPAMAFIVKGAPIKAVAAMAGRPLLLTLAVRADGSVKTVADLKGKKVGVSTVGSLTYWVADELSRQRGWVPAASKSRLSERSSRC